MAKLSLPSDFAAEIAKALGWKLAQVNETFDFEEDKQGFFWARLKPKKFLEKPDFRTMCALTRDLGGEGYLQGAKAWKVPSLYAKKAEAPKPVTESSKPVTTSIPVPSVVPDVMKYDKSKPPEPEPKDFAEVTCSVCGAVFRLVHHGLHDHRAEYYRGEDE